MTDCIVDIRVDPRDFPKVEEYYAGSPIRYRLTSEPGIRWVLAGAFTDSDVVGSRLDELER